MIYKSTKEDKTIEFFKKQAVRKLGETHREKIEMSKIRDEHKRNKRIELK